MRKSLFVALAALMLLASCGKESSEKKILSFKFAAPAVEATISEEAHTIVAVVPFGTNVTGLVPIITVSEKANVVPASGTVVDFTNPVDFTVTAEDGSTVVYKATVTVDPNGGGGGGGGGGTGDPTTWSGNIDANTTWPDLGLDVDYVVNGYVYIDGNALLTIEPGVTIMFEGVGDGFCLGENAGLKMVGTADKPIRLVNALNDNHPGAWYGIQISSKRNDNQFEYVEFVNGGSGDDVITVFGKLSMKHCTIDGALHQGVALGGDGVFTAFENNTIKNCGGYPVWLNETNKASILGSGNTYVENGSNMINLASNYLYENTTINNQGIPYYVQEGLYVPENVKITIEPGVELTFDYDRRFEITGDARFEANGTESQPIIFRGTTPEDLWEGIMFESTRNGNVMNYCQIKNCGPNDGWGERSCLYIRSDAKLTLTNNVFGPSDYNGVGIENISNWGNITHSGNTFVDCAGGNVWLENGGDWNGAEYAPNQILNDLP